MNRDIWLWLLLVMLPYNDRTLTIVEHYRDVRKAAEAIRDGKCDMITPEEYQRAQNIRMGDVKTLLSVCQTNGISILTIEDETYPVMLRDIYNAPIVLFVKGNLEFNNNETTLAVVGSRKCSDYAITATTKICSELGALGITIVSGLAAGVDSAAHNAALSTGTKTIGVLACGHLVNYPATPLKHDIIKQGGAIISELPPHTAVNKDYFQQRNRIISGLSHGVFIVEANEISGCHHTARHAIQQNRELLCMPPHDIFNNKCTGVCRYLRDGATPVFGAVDIINTLKYHIFSEA